MVVILMFQDLEEKIKRFKDAKTFIFIYFWWQTYFTALPRSPDAQLAQNWISFIEKLWKLLSGGDYLKDVLRGPQVIM